MKRFRSKLLLAVDSNVRGVEVSTGFPALPVDDTVPFRREVMPLDVAVANVFANVAGGVMGVVVITAVVVITPLVIVATTLVRVDTWVKVVILLAATSLDGPATASSHGFTTHSVVSGLSTYLPSFLVGVRLSTYEVSKLPAAQAI